MSDTRQKIIAAAHALRRGEDAVGAHTTAEVIGVISDRMASGSITPTPQISKALGEALSALERRDTLWLADMLEHEIASLFLHD